MFLTGFIARKKSAFARYFIGDFERKKTLSETFEAKKRESGSISAFVCHPWHQDDL